MTKSKCLNKLLAIVLSFMQVVACVFVAERISGDAGRVLAADVLTHGDLQFTESSGKLTVSKYTGSGGQVTIPSSVNGKPVTAIGNNAFYYAPRVSEVIIPDSVVSIGNNAFSRCSSLSGIVLPDRLERIGDGAFYYCISLASLHVPDGVEYIGDYAFTGCIKLYGLDVGSGNGYYSSSGGVLYNKDKTALLFCPANKTGVFKVTDSVTDIGVSAFYMCKELTGVSLPDGLRSIGKNAFYGCKKLNGVIIPGKTAVIGNNAFEGCESLRSVILYNGIGKIGEYAFSGCKSLSDVYIPDSVDMLGDFAFSDCSSLRHVRLGKNIAIISSGLFSSCTSLSSIDIPFGVLRVNDSAFSECTALKSISLPASVSGVEMSAFAGCSGLASMSFSSGMKQIYDFAFSGCTGLRRISVPKNVSYIEDFAFDECSDLTVYGVSRKKSQQIADENGFDFEELTESNTSTVSSKLIVKGESLTVCCDAVGGAGDYTYAVFYKQKSQTKWTCAQNYSDNILVSITPKAATVYNVRVKAKDRNGTIVNKDFVITVNKPLDNTSSISSPSITKGDAVTVSCSAAGGHGVCQYAVFYKQKTQSKWTCVQNYNTNTQVDVIPKAAVEYQLRVKAQDACGKVSNRDFSFTVNKK